MPPTEIKTRMSMPGKRDFFTPEKCSGLASHTCVGLAAGSSVLAADTSFRKIAVQRHSTRSAIAQHGRKASLRLDM